MDFKRKLISRCVVCFKNNNIKPLSYYNVSNVSYNTDSKSITIDEIYVRHIVCITDCDRVIVECENLLDIIWYSEFEKAVRCDTIDKNTNFANKIMNTIGVK
ncbi:MAG: hypothetical protein ACRCXT_00925 [Paraclostridium sp.]